MPDQEEEELRRALRMSMQNPSPDSKRSKPLDVASTPVESPEAKNRKLQRELMAAAAEKRMKEAINSTAASASASATASASSTGSEFEKYPPTTRAMIVCDAAHAKKNEVDCAGNDVNLGNALPEAEASKLFSMMFGAEVTKGILAQWCNQGIRFSTDPETSMGLVQHEGGPCGVLAAIQGYIIKHLLFSPEELGNGAPNMPGIPSPARLFQGQHVTSQFFSSLTEDRKSRSLVRSMAEILFLCGNNQKATIATLDVTGFQGGSSKHTTKNEVVAEALEGLSIESESDLQKILRVHTYTSLESTLKRLEATIPIFQSRMGAMLFLISALLSRGLDDVQADRDDPTQALVTAPFGHASQEIVNLLLCGQAVPNLFDGWMDLGGGMSLKGISMSVEIGFLTLLESLNLCKVGQHLKCPKCPIWVVGSESHYTVLFALDRAVQAENDLEERESQIRKAFDAQDQSGGGGFISVEGFQQVLRETGIDLPQEKLSQLCNTGFIVWSDFWLVLLEVDKSLGGLKDSSGLMGKKVFDLYHFNGIAKSVTNGVQRPRLTKLRVLVPPRWTPEEFMAGVTVPSGLGGTEPSGKDGVVEVDKPEPAQHAPLVDCVRTRWPRATCSWEGDAPSIV